MKNIRSLSSKRYLIIGLLFFMVVMGTLMFSAYAKIREGDSYVLRKTTSLNQIKENFQQASVSYKEAYNLWPLLRFDTNLKTKIQLTEQGIKDLNNNQVVILLKNDATEGQAQSLIDEIKNVVGVQNVKFVSEDEAFQKLEMINDKDSELFNDLIAKDMVSAYIEVYVPDIENTPLIKAIRQITETKSFVEQVDLKTNLR